MIALAQKQAQISQGLVRLLPRSCCTSFASVDTWPRYMTSRGDFRRPLPLVALPFGLEYFQPVCTRHPRLCFRASIRVHTMGMEEVQTMVQVPSSPLGTIASKGWVLAPNVAWPSNLWIRDATETLTQHLSTYI